MTRDFTDSQLDAIGAGLKAGEPVEKVLANLPAGPKKRLKNDNEESRSQKMLVKWWSTACKRFDIPEQLLFSIPNGMAFGGKAEWQVRTSIIRGKNAKLEGLRPGIPDLMLAVPGHTVDFGKNPPFNPIRYDRTWMALFIEMKTAAGVISPEQTLIHSLLSARGYCVKVCRSTEEAIKEIESYLS